MDITDRKGDAATGVVTVPVLLGPAAALRIGCVLVGGCWALSVWAALGRAELPLGLAWLCSFGVPAGGQRLARWAAATALSAVAARMAAPLATMWREGLSEESTAKAVERLAEGVGAGTLLLAAMG